MYRRRIEVKFRPRLIVGGGVHIALQSPVDPLRILDIAEAQCIQRLVTNGGSSCPDNLVKRFGCFRQRFRVRKLPFAIALKGIALALYPSVPNYSDFAVVDDPAKPFDFLVWRRGRFRPRSDFGPESFFRLERRLGRVRRFGREFDGRVGRETRTQRRIVVGPDVGGVYS